MKNLNIPSKTLAVSLIVVICLAGVVFFYQQNRILQKKINDQEAELEIQRARETWDIEDQSFNDRITLDINGDGLPERVVNPTMNARRGEEPAFNYLVALNYKNEEIGRTPEWFDLPFYSKYMGSYKLKEFADKDHLAMVVRAGVYQTETMFLELVGSELLPVCKVEKQEEINDCLFYNTRDFLVVDDLNHDSFMEVIEVVDEYPAAETIKLDNETQKTIREVFGEKADEAMMVARHEYQGWGRPVIWGIYSFNGKYFEPLLGEDYDWYFDLMFEVNSNLMKRSEMTKEAIEQTQSTRDFCQDLSFEKL